MNRALKLTAEDSQKKDVAALHLDFGSIINPYNAYGQAWRLQYLTDWSNLPDYDAGQGYEYGRVQGAPVDVEGMPVFHKMPDSFESAESDGQRWRWLLGNAAMLNPDFETHVQYMPV